MNQGNDRAFATGAPATGTTSRTSRTSAARRAAHRAAPRNPLRELPDGDHEAGITPLPLGLAERLEAVAARLAARGMPWRLGVRFEDLPLSTARHVAAATAVGVAVALRVGAGWYWPAPLVTLALAGGVLCGVRRVRRLAAAAAGLAQRLLRRAPVPEWFRGPAGTVTGPAGVALLVTAAARMAGAGTGVGIVLVGLQLGFVASVAGVVRNLRDFAFDRKHQRWTVTARFGVPAGRCQAALCALVPFVLGVYWLLAGALAAALIPLIALPLALWVIRDVKAYLPGPIFERFLPRAATLHVTYATLLTLGLVL